MEHIFFNHNGGIENAAAKAFNALGMERSLEGDSANNASGIYFEYTAFGVKFKIEENVYGFEDEFEYMLSIRKDMLTDLEVPDDVPSVLASIASRMLAKNLNVEVGIETGDKVQIVAPR